MYVSNRYCSDIAKWCDQLSFLLMNPWLTAFSHFVSCYISTIYEKHHPQHKLVDYFLFGPLYLIVVLLLLPFGVLGIIIWILLCTCIDQEKYTYLYFNENPLENFGNRENESGIYTLASINVLLAPEVVARLNNNKCSYVRTSQIAERILKHTGKPLCNLLNGDCLEIKSKYDSVLSEFPCLDFLCLQEVWERAYALTLIEHLKKEFPYFIYDVGDYSFSKNLCMLGSGLFFASKKPVLDIDFNIFTFRTKHAKYTSQGVLCIKVFLSYDNTGERHVGYIANIHTQAFQGRDAVLSSQLTDVNVFVSLFKEQTAHPLDVIDFDIICGDFNADNMSPGDVEVQQHALFQEYRDICAVDAGQDAEWAIGTELRQSMLYQPDIVDPESFREMLVDDSLRRLYVLDADVLVHSTHLMTSVVHPGPGGYVEALPHGGRRRVDRILYKGATKEIIGYCFLSALTNLTDHLPVCMTLKPQV
ncbi:sphingomyelin phosphodiesterase 3-like isoform X1 [Periplaneta americana]|uniref:sphingomyelin phosphodiesterase 3-like isoform X1 n=1 Tax=Periplaneta americana TaxID=6978 RepID=UPI0037E97D06